MLLGAKLQLFLRSVNEILVRPAIIGCLLFNLLSLATQAQATKAEERSSLFAQNLCDGLTLKREIKGDQVHYYWRSLDAGHYLRVAVEQCTAAVTITLRDANGAQLLATDSAGDERISLLAAQPLRYYLEVRARQPQAVVHYTIRVDEVRAATPRDEWRVKAESLMADAAQLSHDGKREALEQAAEKYKEAAKLWQTLAEGSEEARAFYLRALNQQDLGAHQAALESYQQALHLSRAVGDSDREHLTLGALGTLYFTLGDKRQAFACYQQALAFSQARADRTTELSLLINLGVAHKALGEHAAALKFYEQARDTARALSDKATEAAALTNLARLYDLTGNKEAASATNQQALTLWRGLGNRAGEATTLKNLGALAENAGHWPEARTYYQQAFLLNEQLGDAARAVHLRGDLARVARAAGDFSGARAEIERALLGSAALRDQLLNPDLRASFAATQRRYHEFHLDLLMEQHQQQPAAGHDRAALEASESMRARVLAELLAEAHIEVPHDADATLLARVQACAQKLTAKQAEQAILRNAPAATIAALDRELLALRAEYEHAQTALKRARVHSTPITLPAVLKLVELQRQLLDPDTLLLEYSLGTKRSYLWVVSHNSLHSFELPPRATIEQQARQFNELLLARSQIVKFETISQRQQRIAQADATLEQVADKLGQTLLAPLKELLHRQRLLVVGDGVLNYIPFGALPLPESARASEPTTRRAEAKSLRRSDSFATFNTPLIVKHEVINLPSASILAQLRDAADTRRAATDELAIVADPIFSSTDQRVALNRKVPVASASVASAPLLASLAIPQRGTHDFARLPFARQEALQIARLAPRSFLALDFRANRELVTSHALDSYRFLHFATHGLLNHQNPELSGLVFSLVNEQGQPQAGVLRLPEIFDLKLAAELVVLSACRTGLGKEIAGEGVIGLTRGFMYAGVPRVMASLWSVDDQATAKLMTHFYRGLLTKKQSPAAALRAAQLAMLKDRQWQAPYYWAAFVLQGEPK
jgi:CHAT domain-containing protein/tetratricopeptide (TPR) repeat protein